MIFFATYDKMIVCRSCPVAYIPPRWGWVNQSDCACRGFPVGAVMKEFGMKDTIRLFGIVLVVTFALAFTACPTNNDEPGPAREEFTITFYLDGGDINGNKNPVNVSVFAGHMITPPPDPTKADAAGSQTPGWLYRVTSDGYISKKFDGWYSGDEKLYFPRTASGSMSVTAKYEAGDDATNVNNDLLAAITHINSEPSTYHLLMSENYTFPTTAPTTLNEPPTQLVSGGHLTIEANTPVTVSRSNNGLIFDLINNNTSVTIGKNITLQGRKPNNANALVRVSGGATFTMEDGSTITENGNTPAYADPAIRYVYGTSAVYVGTSGNNAPSATYVPGTFIMKGGKITNNDSSFNYGDWGGAAVTVANGGKFIMGEEGKTSTAEISGNTSTLGMTGAAVHVVNGTFTMYGGTITGNTGTVLSGISTGGVFVHNNGSALFEMKGGEICDNTISSTNSSFHDVFVHSTAAADTGRITLEGNVKIGVLTLNAAAAASSAYIGVTDMINGSSNIGLNLRSAYGIMGNASTALSAIGWWANSASAAYTRGIVVGVGYTWTNAQDIINVITPGKFFTDAINLNAVGNFTNLSNLTVFGNMIRLQ